VPVNRFEWFRAGALPCIARLLVSAEFIVALNGKVFGWQSQADYMSAKGMHHVSLLLAAAAAIEGVGSLALVLGYRAKWAASLLFVYLTIVTLRLHAFWQMSGFAAAANTTEFFKNLGILGGLLMLAVYGAGQWSVDRLR
jgi:putative oxidoreductase